MTILYYPFMSNSIFNTPKMVSDYQSDTIFHGLRKLLGVNVVDYKKLWWMYKNEKDERVHKIWGRGFSVYNLLNDIPIDRTNIEDKIKQQLYDYIVIPIHHSQINNTAGLSDRIDYLEHYGYNKKNIIIIDGHDKPNVKIGIARRTQYFKRELVEQYANLCKPISFSIPQEKICRPLKKRYSFSPLVPAKMIWNSEHLKSYIYNCEKNYYDDYRTSYFAYNCCKAGWDTMRLLEILACGCLPFFTDIESCPQLTLFNHPKEIYKQIKSLSGVIPGRIDDTLEVYDTRNIKIGEERGRINYDKFSNTQYEKIQSLLYQHLCEHLTTKAMAQYFLKEIKE